MSSVYSSPDAPSRSPSFLSVRSETSETCPPEVPTMHMRQRSLSTDPEASPMKRDSHKPTGPYGGAAYTGPDCCGPPTVTAAEASSGEPVPRPRGGGQASVYAPKHPFLRNHDDQVNEGLGGAVGYGVTDAGGGGGFSVDPDGGQGCCSGLGHDVFCCCGVCAHDGEAALRCAPRCCSCKCGAAEGCGECCVAGLHAPVACVGGACEWAGECAAHVCGEWAACLGECLPCCLHACAVLCGDGHH